jgi:RNA polymerase sigma-70 factor (sigma-E family)
VVTVPNRGDIGRVAGDSRRHLLLEAIYVSQLSALTRTAALLLGDAAQAEDVVQEAFARVYASWHRIEDQDKAVAYVRRSVVNLCRSEIRRRVVARRLPERSSPPSPSAEDDALTSLDRSAVVQVLGTLSRRQREAVVLRYFLGLSEAEIAGAMGVSAGSVKAYAARGREELGRRLEEAGG